MLLIFLQLHNCQTQRRRNATYVASNIELLVPMTGKGRIYKGAYTTLMPIKRNQYHSRANQKITP